MSENTIKEKLEEYLRIQKEIHEMRKKQKEHKNALDSLEKDIQEYMVNNTLNSISTKHGEIILYDKKTSQTLKKETMIEKLSDELKNTEAAEKLVDSILSNKVFTTTTKIKAKLKKN